MAGLFSNLGQPQNQNQNQPSGSGGLFGASTNNATTSAQTGGGLFGSTPASQPQQQSTLFGGGAAQSQPQSSSGLFAGLGSQPQQQQSNLFGSSTTQSQPQSSNLFGGLGSQPQQSSGTSGGLFGNLGASTSQSQPQQSTGGGLFGGLGASTSQPANTGLFGNTLGQQQQQQQSGPTNQAGQQSAATGQAAYFNNLLERGKKRNKQENGTGQNGDLPGLQLGLGDIARKVRNLGTGGPSAQQAKAGDTRAHYLLAASGVSTAGAIRDLNTFSVQANARPSSSHHEIHDTDIEGYIEKLHAKTTLDLMKEAMEQDQRDFDAWLEENVQMEWDSQRRRIYEHFGLVKPDEELDPATSAVVDGNRGAFGRSSRRSRMAASSMGMSFGASGMTKSVLGPSGRSTMRGNGFGDSPDKTLTSSMSPAPEDRFQREKQEKYAEKVRELNMARCAATVYPVLQQFREVEAQAGVDHTAYLVDSYNALVSITGENPDVQGPNDPAAVKERQYVGDYLDENTTSAKCMRMRKRIIDGSRRFLEKKFYKYIEADIEKNPKDAELGGVPTPINKVRAHIKLLNKRKELSKDPDKLMRLNDDYCWALIFFLLRCGLVKEAAQYVKENERAIRSMHRMFPQYIIAYAADPDHRLYADLQTSIVRDYSQLTKLGRDDDLEPYRMACLKILGRCELNKRTLTDVHVSMEDWVWLQFTLAREVSRAEEAAGDVFGLEELRATIEDIGKRHFSQGSEGIGVFFYLQILAGLFEQAVAHLYTQNYVSTVHFAIGLAFYGLLRVSDFNTSASELLSFTTKQQPQINFGRMLGYYTRDSRTARPEVATDYLCLICINADLPGQLGRSQAAVCHEALRELVLETREFAQLLGDIRSDGKRIKGAIEERLKLIQLADQQEFLKTVTLQAGAIANDNGRITDAVLLYHLAEDFDSVVCIINEALSEAICVNLDQAAPRLDNLKPRADQPTEGSSLSLTSTEDPFELAKTMINLYNSNALYWKRVAQKNRDACGVLLQISEVRRRVQEQRWADALDMIKAVKLLPVDLDVGDAEGERMPAIRSLAQNFSAVPQTVARTIGPLLVWTVLCCARQRDVLLARQFNEGGPSEMANLCARWAKDCMTFAGLVKYRLGRGVWDQLASLGGL